MKIAPKHKKQSFSVCDAGGPLFAIHHTSVERTRRKRYAFPLTSRKPKPLPVKSVSHIIMGLESLVSRRPDAAASKIVEILDTQTDGPLLTYAAQRIRVFPLDHVQRDRAWKSLQSIVRRWLEMDIPPESLDVALPSVLPVGRSEAVEFTRNIILNASEELVESIVLGLFTGSPMAGSLEELLQPHEVRTLFLAILNRLSCRTGPMPNSVWAIGPTTTESCLKDAILELKVVFENPKGLEDATAVRAGRMIVSRWRTKATLEILATFDKDQGARFLAYLIPPGK